MILVMDVGNLEMLLGVFQDKTLMASWKWLQMWHEHQMNGAAP